MGSHWITVLIWYQMLWYTVIVRYDLCTLPVFTICFCPLRCLSCLAAVHVCWGMLSTCSMYVCVYWNTCYIASIDFAVVYMYCFIAMNDSSHSLNKIIIILIININISLLLLFGSRFICLKCNCMIRKTKQFLTTRFWII